ncbi:hypothetical protein BCR44DRAFT_27855 [Catenaria anguillulae PL171]|uniref:G-patch domain-containing protein n=1 Tax=Catenaria anguillulae PL171 TaxID=765915 RepID=A0A1Y2HLL8_9FUNG|nr:hypothetical protein BCR44DRAFT_27855 [Catenaria anguillulae PL171]
MHRGLGASSRPSKKRSHSTQDDEDGNDNLASGDGAVGDALATPIATHNPGYKLLLKLGWTAGKGLGATESGRVDPIPHYSHIGTMGLGQWQQDLEYMSLATSRPISIAERLATETDADREKREAKLQRDEATKAEVDAVKRALYRCDICNKQYNKQHELDSHLGSYEHHHAKRAREMREAERKLAKEGGEVEKEKKRAKRREEREMEMMVKAAAAATPAGSVSVGPHPAVSATLLPGGSWPAAAQVPAPLSAAPVIPHHVQQQHYAAQYAAYYAQTYGAHHAGYPPAAPVPSYPWPHQQHQVQQLPHFSQAPPMHAQPAPLPHIVPPALSTELVRLTHVAHQIHMIRFPLFAPVSLLSATSHPAPVSTSAQTIPTSSPPAAVASSNSTSTPRPVISFGLGRKFKK